MSIDIEDTIGFNRPCLRDPIGTVDLYHKHLFLCTGVAADAWPDEVDKLSDLFSAISKAIKENREALGKLKLSATDLPSYAGSFNASSSGYDCLVFDGKHKGVKVHGITAEKIADFISYLKTGTAMDGLKVENLTQENHIFICSHQARDKRCGHCGPRLLGDFESKISARGLSNKIKVGKTSHVGGHEYAGNVLVFPEGTWYGYVKPDDVDRILDDHIIQGKLLTEKLRGRMGLSGEQQRALKAAN